MEIYCEKPPLISPGHFDYSISMTCIIIIITVIVSDIIIHAPIRMLIRSCMGMSAVLPKDPVLHFPPIPHTLPIIHFHGALAFNTQEPQR